MPKQRESSQQKKLPPPPPRFKPLSIEQAKAYKACVRNHIAFLTGPAGCSKSYTAIAYAVDSLLNGMVEKIVLTRPSIEACGEHLGYLPGTATEKLGSYMIPLFDNLNEYAGSSMIAIRPCLEVSPLAFMRGRTFKNAVVVLDEAQNASIGQLKMLLTRIGQGTTMILCGDAGQSDIGRSPLLDVAREMARVEGIEHFHYSATSGIIRHPLMPAILEGFENLGVGDEETRRF